jgi:hypothetical protein
MPARTIFLSSTARDLEQYRKAVFEAIEALDGYHCIRMESFGRSARAESPLDYCNSQAAECDVFVILVGHCWGSTPDGQRSFTEYEFDSADAHKRLVFVAADDFTVPANLIEGDVAREKQRSFRERAKSGQITSFFRDPQELATKVVLSIRNWEESKPKAAAAPAPRRENAPNLGRLAAKTCDRREQERQFRENFLRSQKQFPDKPQIYLVSGSEGQCHDSLVERLLYRVGFGFGEQASRITRLKTLPWEYEGGPAERVARLAFSAYESLATAEESRNAIDATPQAISEVLGLQSDACTALQHEVFGSRWDGQTLATIREYASFWSEVRTPKTECVLLFFNILIPGEGESAKPSRFFSGSYWRERQIRSDLDKITQTADCPIFRLKELTMITRDDVHEWMKLNNIYSSDRERLEALDRLFPKSGGAPSPRRMAEVESLCEQMVHNVAVERL